MYPVHHDKINKMEIDGCDVQLREITEDNRKVMLVESCQDPSGVNLVNTYRTNKVDSMDLVALAKEIQMADKFVHANASNKLQVIAEQVRFLQEQARKFLEEAKDSFDLHHIPCNFVKKPGEIYYLYERPTGQKHFAMLSPSDWGSSCPHKYIGAFRLEFDQSWTPENKLNKRQGDQELINKILASTNTLSITMRE